MHLAPFLPHTHTYTHYCIIQKLCGILKQNSLIIFLFTILYVYVIIIHMRRGICTFFYIYTYTYRVGPLNDIYIYMYVYKGCFMRLLPEITTTSRVAHICITQPHFPLYSKHTRVHLFSFSFNQLIRQNIYILYCVCIYI